MPPSRPVPEAQRSYLRELVRHLGGVRAVAKELGICVSTIEKWSQGRGWPSKAGAERLAQLANTVPEALRP